MIKVKPQSWSLRNLLHGTHLSVTDVLTTSRPIQLLITVALTAITFVGLDAATGWHVWDRLFYPSQKTPADVQAWSALIYAIALVLGLPVAFLLWHWRDRNVRDQIDNARKDINLKEFQEVQLRAAGALDDKLPEESREQLQVAALHQLRGFLRGEYGESFRRPAFELLLSGHAAAMERIGVPEVKLQINDPDKVWARIEIMKAISQIYFNLNRVDRERMNIIRDEKQLIFNSNFPLEERSFDLLDLKEINVPEKTSLARSSFVGANLRVAEFNGAELNGAHFEGARLGKARLNRASLSGAHFEGANLDRARLKNASFWGTHFESADLKDVHFENARLYHCFFEGAYLVGYGTHYLETCYRSRYDDLTVFAIDDDPNNLPNAQTGDEIRKQWQKLGALHVDEF